MGEAIIMKGGAGGVDCDNATAVQSDVLSGKTFGMAGKDDIQIGTMTNNGSKYYSLPINGKQIIPKGYHDGNGYVNQSIATQGYTYITPSTSDQYVYANRYLTGNVTVAGSANLVASNIRSGVTIWGVTGTLVDYESGQVIY